MIKRIVNAIPILIGRVGSVQLARPGVKGNWDAGVAYWRGLMLLLAGIMTMAIFPLWFITRRRRRSHEARRSSIFFMNALMNRLESLGWNRSESQTVAELIGRVETETQGRWHLQWILDLYHRYRFGQETPSMEEEDRIKEIIRSIR